MPSRAAPPKPLSGCKPRRESANEIPLTPLNTIPLPPSPAHGSHTANTLQICNEQSRLPTRCALARRPAARQQKCVVSRREPRAIGSRRVFHAVPHDRHHLSKPLKRRCGQQKPETSLHLKAIMRGVPREKARSEPVVSAPPLPICCPAAAQPLPLSCPLIQKFSTIRENFARLLMNLQLFCYTMDEPLDGLLTTREPLAMRSGAGRDPGSCTICELSENFESILRIWRRI